MTHSTTLNLWAVARPAPDVPGEWVAHCLELDVMSQGSSLRQAFDMLSEAVQIAWNEDSRVGRDPLSHRAPDDCWAELWEVVNRGERGPIAELEKLPADADLVIAAQLELLLLRQVPPAPAPKPPRKVQIPAAFTARAPLQAHC